MSNRAFREYFRAPPRPRQRAGEELLQYLARRDAEEQEEIDRRARAAGLDNVMPVVRTRRDRAENERRRDAARDQARELLDLDVDELDERFEQQNEQLRQFMTENIIQMNQNLEHEFEINRLQFLQNDPRRTLQRLADGIINVPGYHTTLRFNFQNGATRHLTLTENNVNALVNGLVRVEGEAWQESDRENVLMLENGAIRSITVLKSPHNQGPEQQAGFWPFANLTEVDLSRYGCWNEIRASNYEENCFVAALNHAFDASEGLGDGINIIPQSPEAKEELLRKARTYIGLNTREAGNVSQTMIREIAKELNLHIILKRPTRNNYKCGDPSRPTIKMGVLNNHSFLIERIPVTIYALRNYYFLKEHLENDEKWGNHKWLKITNFKVKNGRPVDIVGTDAHYKTCEFSNSYDVLDFLRCYETIFPIAMDCGDVDSTMSKLRAQNFKMYRAPGYYEKVIKSILTQRRHLMKSITQSSEIMDTIFHNNVPEDDVLEYNRKKCSQISWSARHSKTLNIFLKNYYKQFSVWFYDFETCKRTITQYKRDGTYEDIEVTSAYQCHCYNPSLGIRKTFTDRIILSDKERIEHLKRLLRYLDEDGSKNEVDYEEAMKLRDELEQDPCGQRMLFFIWNSECNKPKRGFEKVHKIDRVYADRPQYETNHYRPMVLMVAHNANFDIQFVRNYVEEPNFLTRGSFLMRGPSCNIIRKGIKRENGYEHVYISPSGVTNKFPPGYQPTPWEGNRRAMGIEFADSYNFIKAKLEKFPGMFKIRNGDGDEKFEKEVMPYSLYTPESIWKRYIPLNTVTYRIEKTPDITDDEWTILCNDPQAVQSGAHLQSFDDYKQLVRNLERLNNLSEYKNILLSKKGEMYFDILKYSEFYCARDVEILAKGYLKFREWFLEDPFYIDINTKWTASQLSDTFMHMSGCYEGVFRLGGRPRKFMQKCVVGGRAMTARNEMHKFEGEVGDRSHLHLQYVDARSKFFILILIG